MYDNKENQLIKLIYEAAIDPAKWTGLMNALVELSDQLQDQSDTLGIDQSLLYGMPSITSNDNRKSNTLISETLKSISNINEDETKSAAVDIGQVNDRLISHFARAIKITKRLVDIDDQHNVVLSLLDRMPIALVLVDPKARVLETNTLANELLSSEEGLTVKSNILDAGSSNNERLLNAIKMMSKKDSSVIRGQSLSLTNEQTQNNIMLFIAPLKEYNSEQQASVAIFISQRNSLPLSLPAYFSEQYALTNKEVKVTEQLVRGLSIKNISEEASISQHTVRSHVKSIFKKTNTSRQAELVSLVYNGLSEFSNPVTENLPKQKNSVLSMTKTPQQDYKVLRLADGRNMAYKEYGDLNGESVFHCHSVVGSRLELPFDTQKICVKKSVRLIVMDRPSYGASSPDPKASFVQWPNDLVQLADHLNIEKFLLTGYALGGVYALACAHEIPERLKRVAIISSGAQIESAADYKTILPMYKISYQVAKYSPKVFKLFSSILTKGLIRDPHSFYTQFIEKLGKADRNIINSEDFIAEVTVSLSEGFRQGGKALAEDGIQLMNDWLFDPFEIKIPLHVWHGTNDYHVPLVVSERLCENVKNSRCFIREGQGHFMFYTHWEEILDELLKQE